MINDAQLYSLNIANNTLYTLLCLNEKKTSIFLIRKELEIMNWNVNWNYKN